MKRFDILILLVYLVLKHDNLILAAIPKDPVDVVPDEDDIHIDLEKLLKIGKIKKKYMAQSGPFMNNCSFYQTEEKKLLFVKWNKQLLTDKMFRGEFESLKTINETNTVKVPTPIAVGHSKDGHRFIVMEYLKLSPLVNLTEEDKYSAELGSRVADMHLHNLHHKGGNETAIKKFGFHITTNIGIIPQNNTWTDDWITFFIENRLSHLIQFLIRRTSDCQDKKDVLETYWPQLKPMIPDFFKGIDVKPSLLHGDLWAAHAKRMGPKPVIIDPASFYGHHEYDIACTTLFGGFSDEFYRAYHKKIPKAEGFEKRMKLYHLYHHLSQWIQYEGGFTTLAVGNFRELLPDS